MPEVTPLIEAQRRFAAAVRNTAAQADVLPLLQGDAARNLALMAVYRGNAVANAGKALALCYPVVAQIVGEEFFGGLCRAFWEASPSQSGDLNEYGTGFADFLADFPHARELPYLPDVARVEWRVHCAAHAVDHEPAATAALAEQDPARTGELRFALQPGFALVSSTWPVASIWLQHQAQFDGEISIDLDSAEVAAIHRIGLRAQVSRLGAGEAALWHAAQAGHSLAEMLEAAFAADEAFDVQAALLSGFTREFVTALHLTPADAP